MSPILVSAASGCIWAGVAFVLGSPAMGWIVWGGVTAAPLIGALAGLMSRGFDRRAWFVQILLALISLYAAAALFGFASGVFDLLAGTNSGPGSRRIPSAVIIQSVLGVWWGLTFTGYVLALWPLAYLNHLFVAKYWSAPTIVGPVARAS